MLLLLYLVRDCFRNKTKEELAKLLPGSVFAVARSTVPIHFRYTHPGSYEKKLSINFRKRVFKAVSREPAGGDEEDDEDDDDDRLGEAMGKDSASKDEPHSESSQSESSNSESEEGLSMSDEESVVEDQN